MRRLLVLTLATLMLLPAAATADGPVGTDPGSNDPLGAMPASCSTAPYAAACENTAITYLDQARAKLGQPAYQLPADFVSLTQDEQALVLVNLDRGLYGLAPMTGVTAALNSDAAGGVQRDDDPTPSDPDLGEYTANWAGGYPNMPAAYEGWMYDDGPGSGNEDCTTTNTSGCWGHRHDVLWDFGGSGAVAIGAASGTDPSGQPGEALLLAQGNSSYAPAYTYTWTAAQADGAGTNSYNPAPPSGTTTTPTGTTTTPTGTTTPPGGTPQPPTPTSHRPPFHVTRRGRSVTIAIRFSPGSPIRCSLVQRANGRFARARLHPCGRIVRYHALPRGRYRFTARSGGETATAVFTV